MTKDVISGEEFQVFDALYAVQLDGKGGLLPITNESVTSEKQPFWLHLNYESKDSKTWLESSTAIPDFIRDDLGGESTRPKVSRINEGLVVTLRSINFSSDHLPDPLVTLRLYISNSYIISTRHRPVVSVDEVYKELQKNNGPINAGDWLVEVSNNLTDHAGDFIDELQDKIVELENDLLNGIVPERGELALIRKQLIILRRHLFPQRDVLSKLANEKMNWLEPDDRRRLQDIADRQGRAVEDLDAGIARTAILSEEISAQLTEETNKRAYTLSLLAAIFLPATLLTGLFGVNLGGIPGADHPMSFFLFTGALICIGLGFGWWLKRSHWF